ncbi:hypothetical protein D3C71_1687060 [compost metagenome]
MGRAGFALDQVERVQMARAHVDQTARILVAGDDFMQLLGAYPAYRVAITERCQVVLFVLERGELRRGIGQLTEAPA